MATTTTGRSRRGRHCQFWLPKKNRFCANPPLHDSSPFCGNHTTRSNQQWIPCPIDPSHSVLEDNLSNHLTRCPLLKQAQSLSLQPYFQKGVNAGSEGEEEDDDHDQDLDHRQQHKPTVLFTSDLKRQSIRDKSVPQFFDIIHKIKNIHASVCNDIIQDSFNIPDACAIWTNRQADQFRT